MKILSENNENPTNVALILGFFDGVHLGHREVINQAVDYAKENASKTVLITFKSSPAEYFQKQFEYIFEREYSYEIMDALGVDYLYECEFSDLVNIPAQQYLEENLIKKFTPISISTGFNHTFGANRQGTPELLEQYSTVYNYEYFCSPACIVEGETVSSTLIKSYLKTGDVEKANRLLNSSFSLKSTVVKGEQLGRKLGFPTANMLYPDKIVKIPHGVYIVKVMEKPAILNWGIKPTVNGFHEGLEVHIPNFEGDLYGQNLRIEFVKKLRDEKKFDNIETLREQIAKDVEICLKSL